MKTINFILFFILLLPYSFSHSLNNGDTYNSEENVQESMVQIREWEVPREQTRPRDPYVASDGLVWFVGQRGDYLAQLSPETGEFKYFELEPGTGPHNCIVDANGMVWYAGNRANHIGVLDPKTGTIEKIFMLIEAARDPHTLVFDNDENIWFTVQGGNYVGKLDRNSREVTLIKVPTPNSRPYGIIVDSANRPWFNLFGTNKLGTVDPQTMEIEEITLPQDDARSRRVAVDSNERIWYVDYAQGYLGVLDPQTRNIREWEMPAGSQSRPYAMAIDANDIIWIVETGISPNRFVGFNQETEAFFDFTDVPSGGGTVRHMYYHKKTHEIWFGTDTNTIGVAQLE